MIPHNGKNLSKIGSLKFKDTGHSLGKDTVAALSRKLQSFRSPHSRSIIERGWHGPLLLLKGPADWPAEGSEIGLKGVDEERERCVQMCFVRTMNPILDLARYSYLLRILRTTAWVLRFIRNCRNVANRISTSTSAEHIKDAELYWICIVQQDSYGDELERLCNQAPLDL